MTQMTANAYQKWQTWYRCICIGSRDCSSVIIVEQVVQAKREYVYEAFACAKWAIDIILSISAEATEMTEITKNTN